MGTARMTGDSTERLIEVIEEQINLLSFRSYTPEARNIVEAVAELRRRGDTLVRRDDLRKLYNFAMSDKSEMHDWFGMLDRLEIALGGKHADA